MNVPHALDIRDIQVLLVSMQQISKSNDVENRQINAHFLILCVLLELNGFG